MNYLTVGQVMRQLGVDYWQVRELIIKNHLGELPKFGGKYAIPESMLPKIKKIMQSKGWIAAG